MNLVQYSNTNFEYKNETELFEYKKLTRFQRHIQKRGEVILYESWSLNDINTIINMIKTSLPNINYYSNINNIYDGIKIYYLDNTFTLSGSNVDLYSFISNDSTLELLDKIRTISKKLSVEKYNSTFKSHLCLSNTDNSCPICLEKFKKDDLLCKTKCNHEFHNSCLKTWLTENSVNNNCPSCRENLLMF
jgi:hypothetical protein